MGGPVGGALLLAALAVYLYLHGVYRFSYPDPVTYPVRGIDVSHHQGTIDWRKVAREDIRFAYLKASEGGDWFDPSFGQNLKEAREAGLAVGAYHYFTLCAPGPVQARNFLRALPPGTELHLPPAIDLEYVGNCAARPGKGKLVRELKAFIRIIQTRFPQPPVIYSTQTFFEDYLDKDPAFAAHPLWVRNLYGESAWARGRTVMFRQFASHARLDGIRGPVDLNVFAGSKKQFAELLASGRMPP
ncbi:MAG: lysozyme [Alphaproteobacteria bacterium]|nr:lysozyme [Alphaproteobacteria bacterium]